MDSKKGECGCGGSAGETVERARRVTRAIAARLGIFVERNSAVLVVCCVRVAFARPRPRSHTRECARCRG